MFDQIHNQLKEYLWFVALGEISPVNSKKNSYALYVKIKPNDADNDIVNKIFNKYNVKFEYRIIGNLKLGH